MNIMKLIEDRQKDHHCAKIPTIAFLGDSVTDGVFELKDGEDGRFDLIYDKENVYHSDLCKLLHLLYPSVSLNIVNAGINGSRSVSGNERLEKDVLSAHPDLTVVCFGLNDVHGGSAKVELYHDTLKTIFERLKNAGSEVIYMTPNMMNTVVSPLLKNERLVKVATACMNFQEDGTFDKYLEAGKLAARECSVPICDVHEKWKQLQSNGVRVTDLLCNHINHPCREMHWLFAVSLLETMMIDYNT